MAHPTDYHSRIIKQAFDTPEKRRRQCVLLIRMMCFKNQNWSIEAIYDAAMTSYKEWEVDHLVIQEGIREYIDMKHPWERTLSLSKAHNIGNIS
jgi:hypothetical protein